MQMNSGFKGCPLSFIGCSDMTKMRMCEGGRCAWWDKDNHCCSVMSLFKTVVGGVTLSVEDTKR